MPWSERTIRYLTQDELRAKGIEVGGPEEAHLGMRSIDLHDPDGHRISIQTPTEASPDWLRAMIE